MSDNATIGYGGRRGIINATVLPPELSKGIKALKDHSAAAVRTSMNERTQRKNLPKTTRNITHTITEQTFTDGLDTKAKKKTTTKRKSN